MTEHRQALAPDAGPRVQADRPRRDDGWLAAGAEPALEELLDDPVMALLWRGDRLDPGLARAAVQALGALVRERDGGGPGARGARARGRPPGPDLAAA